MKEEKIDRRVFETAYNLWTSRGEMITTRQRLKRYTYGDQWGDIVNVEGRRMVERDWIVSTGRKPITNNLIRRMVKSIVGRFRDMATSARWYEDTPHADSLEELDSRLLEEFLISGMAIQRVADDNPLLGFEPEVVNVSPEAFICNEYFDPRGRDIEMAGMLHDMSPAEVMMRFGGIGRVNKSRLMQLLRQDDSSLCGMTGVAATFFTPRKGRYRVIEIWTREYSVRQGVKWRVRWFTASGVLLDSYLSPWAHGQHPFVIKFYPLTDGEVHSFVEDLIDQQYYINRIIVMIDRIMSTSAKGVLLFPIQQKLDGISLREIGERWSRPDGIIPISGNTDIMPQQIGGTTADVAAYRLLEMELKLFDQTSGVGAALLGNAGGGAGGAGAEHYKAQVENATIALADIFRTFLSHIKQRNETLLSLQKNRND